MYNKNKNNYKKVCLLNDPILNNTTLKLQEKNKGNYLQCFPLFLTSSRIRKLSYFEVEPFIKEVKSFKVSLVIEHEIRSWLIPAKNLLSWGIKYFFLKTPKYLVYTQKELSLWKGGSWGSKAEKGRNTGQVIQLLKGTAHKLRNADGLYKTEEARRQNLS